MYKAFNFQAPDINYDDSYSDFIKVVTRQRREIKQAIKDFRRSDGNIDGEKMKSDWFPIIKDVDIFISHSHFDEKYAVKLGSFLYDTFGLKSFIDSLVWENAADMLLIIDNDMCLHSNGRSFSYEKRNMSTAHVHMMLMVALTEMIDMAECVLFINTPDSVTPYSSVQDGTISPWIFSELSITKLIREKPPTAHRKAITKMAEDFRADSVYSSIVHSLPTKHLHPLNIDDLKRWKQDWQVKKPDPEIHALDVLYKLIRNL